jgi:hypothetical protein
MWKEAVMASFEVQFWHLPGGIEENQKNLNHENWSLAKI